MDRKEGSYDPAPAGLLSDNRMIFKSKKTGARFALRPYLHQIRLLLPQSSSAKGS